MDYFKLIEPWVKYKLNQLTKNQQKKPKYIQERQVHVKEFIKKLLENKQFNIQKQSENEVQFNKIHKYEKFENIQGKISFKINLDKRQLEIVVIFLRNGIPLTAQYYPFRLLLCRYFNKLNSNEVTGVYKINPQNGQILYIVHLLRISQNYEKTLCLNYVNSKINRIIEQTQIKIAKILALIDKSQSQEYQLKKKIMQKKKKRQNKQKNSQDQQKIQHSLQILINFFHTQHKLMYDEQLKKNVKNIITQQIQQDSSNQQVKLINLANLKTLQMSFKYSFKKQFNLQLKKQKIFEAKRKILQKNYDRYVKHLTFPATKIPQKDRPQIYNQIVILAPQKIQWEKINEGGFSYIQKAKVTFYYKYDKDGKQQIYTKQSAKQLQIAKYLVRKISKQTRSGIIDRVQHEKEILKKIQQKSNMNIAKFYFSNQDKFRNNLFIDFYGSKTLKHFIKSHQFTMSLLSKFYLCSQIIQGVRFLADNQITHFDIKPQNILIGKSNLIKISDFGQAHCTGIKSRILQRGYTVPYAPPESFNEQKQIDSSIDVYSLCILTNQIFFENHLYKMRRLRYTEFQEYLTKQNYEEFIITATQNVQKFGPYDIMILLKRLILQGLSKNRQERPKLDWMVIFFKQNIVLIDKLLQ